MANDLALIEQIQLPANPDRLPSWPAWLRQRNAVLESGLDLLPNGIPDPYGQATLPRELILNSSERVMVEQHIAELSRHVGLDQPFKHRDRVLTNDQAISTMIAELLLRRKGAKLDKAASDALTDEYLDALEDLPAWTVRAARRKWNRGESVRMDPKKPHDFTWNIEPPVLRYLATVELAGIKWEMRQLKRLLGATVRMTEDQLADGRAAMVGLSIAIKSGDFDAARALTFERAIERGERERAEAATLIVPMPNLLNSRATAAPPEPCTFDPGPEFKVRTFEDGHPTGAYQEAETG